MKERAQVELKDFATVSVVNGKLAGMVCAPDHIVAQGSGEVRVVYKTEDKGPDAHVTHRKIAGNFDPARNAEDLRIALAKLVPASVRWESGKGYSDSTSGAALQWGAELARFVPVVEKAKKRSAKNEK